MPHIDLIVVVALVASFAACARLMWRRGARGRLLAAGLVAGFHATAVVVMLAGHCLDVTYSTVLGNRSVDGSVFAYNWRTYSLLLFGAVLIRLGVACLGSALRLASGDVAARTELLRSIGVVVLVVAPTIPLHGIFGWAISGLSAVAALVVATAAPQPRRATAPLAVGAA